MEYLWQERENYPNQNEYNQKPNIRTSGTSDSNKPKRPWLCITVKDQKSKVINLSKVVRYL